MENIKRIILILGVIFPAALFANYNTALRTGLSSCGCHALNATIPNFVTNFQSGELKANTLYRITLNIPANQRAGRNAFQLKVVNATNPQQPAIGTFTDMNSQPLQPVQTQNQTITNTLIVENDDTGTNTSRTYYWLSPAAPVNLPKEVLVETIVLDGNNGGNDALDVWGFQQFILRKPGEAPKPMDPPPTDDDLQKQEDKKQEQASNSQTTNTSTSSNNSSSSSSNTSGGGAVLSSGQFDGNIIGGCGLITVSHMPWTSWLGLWLLMLPFLGLLMRVRNHLNITSPAEVSDKSPPNVQR